jgi:DivIVA domain-containing protein
MKKPKNKPKNKKDKGAEDAQDFAGMPAPTTITSADIQQKEFGVSRFGGYRMRDVDEFLDRVTESMTKLADENQRLRSATGLPAVVVSPAIGAPDLIDTSRQADEIIERARAEAAKIVQDARETAVTTAGSPVDPGTDAGRAAVAAFLSQERDFLQNLATLVQGHAESVKGMAKASRASRSSAPSVAAPAPAPAPEPAPRKTAQDATPAAPTTQPMQVIRPAASPEPSGPTPEAEAPMSIRVEEPATASVGAGDSDEDSEKSDGGDRTLRELFWGEE